MKKVSLIPICLLALLVLSGCSGPRRAGAVSSAVSSAVVSTDKAFAAASGAPSSSAGSSAADSGTVSAAGASAPVSSFTGRAVTRDEAIALVAKKIGGVDATHKLVYDHSETVGGRDCYILHYYEVVEDSASESHAATLGWYAVEKSSGAAFKIDVVSWTLLPF